MLKYLIWFVDVSNRGVDAVGKDVKKEPQEASVANGIG